MGSLYTCRPLLTLPSSIVPGNMLYQQVIISYRIIFLKKNQCLRLANISRCGFMCWPFKGRFKAHGNSSTYTRLKIPWLTFVIFTSSPGWKIYKMSLKWKNITKKKKTCKSTLGRCTFCLRLRFLVSPLRQTS